MNDVRVVQPRGEARLVEEHLHERGIFRAVAQLLDNDELVEACRTGGGTQIDVGHASASQRGEQPIPAGNQLAASDGP